MKKVTIIGGGPSALILAAQLDTQKYHITIYDRKKTVGRKFLVAGEGGLNLTFNAPIKDLISKYVPSEFMAQSLTQFTNTDLMNWLKSLEVDTFIGSSNRVFPVKRLKPIEVLNKIVEHLKNKGVKFQLDSPWTGWNKQGNLCFDQLENVESDITMFALGGASWKVTGSDGGWSDIFYKRGINMIPFRPANCAFSVDWKKDFIQIHEGKPLKNIAITFQNHSAKGELVVSKFGLEGNAIYALSQKIQDALLTKETVVIYIDLKPSLNLEQLKIKYKNSRSSKMTDILKRDIKLDKTAIGLLKQSTNKETFLNADKLIKTIKAVPIIIQTAEEMDKAISTLGGIALDEIDNNFQFKKIPNTYAIGEMLDWYAPTGGYLLQGCFSMGFSLAEYLNKLA